MKTPSWSTATMRSRSEKNGVSPEGLGGETRRASGPGRTRVAKAKDKIDSLGPYRTFEFHRCCEAALPVAVV
jgi:hypothetical protein